LNVRGVFPLMSTGSPVFFSLVTTGLLNVFSLLQYPFTTVIPNLGVWIPSELQNDSTGEKSAGSAGVVLCDVPGLIAGAADGVGLGHAFLRHVERCRVILHLVDGTSEDPVGDYKMVQEEIRRYGTGTLADKPQVVVVNKIDAWESEGSDVFEQRKRDLEEKLKTAMGHTRIMWVSAKERQNMDELMKRMAAYVVKIKEEDAAKAT
jgi:GTPase